MGSSPLYVKIGAANNCTCKGCNLLIFVWKKQKPAKQVNYKRGKSDEAEKEVKDLFIVKKKN